MMVNASAGRYQGRTRKVAEIFCRMADLERELLAELEAIRSDLECEEFHRYLVEGWNEDLYGVDEESGAPLWEGAPITPEMEIFEWSSVYRGEFHTPPGFDNGSGQVMAAWAKHWAGLAEACESSDEGPGA